MEIPDSLEGLKASLRQSKHRASKLFSKQSNFSTVTLFLLAALQRVESNIAGFQAMVMTRNYPVACAIVRLQIDTAMRVHGLRLMADPHEGTLRLLSGERYDQIRPKRGDKLRDTVLLKALGAEFEWVKKVYERTSGMVHLSGMHIHSVFNHATSVQNDDGSLSIELAIGAEGPKISEELYDEISAAFIHISTIADAIITENLENEQRSLNCVGATQ